MRSSAYARPEAPKSTLQPMVDQRVLFGLWQTKESFLAQLGYSSANGRLKSPLRSTAGQRAPLRPTGGRRAASFYFLAEARIDSEFSIKSITVLKKKIKNMGAFGGWSHRFGVLTIWLLVTGHG